MYNKKLHRIYKTYIFAGNREKITLLYNSELFPGLLEHVRLHHGGGEHRGRSHGRVRGKFVQILKGE
jgi:hypothetical protein